MPEKNYEIGTFTVARKKWASFLEEHSKEVSLTEAEKFELIKFFHDLYFQTEQSAVAFGAEYMYLVELILSSKVPLKLLEMTDWEEHIVELFPRYKDFLKN